MSDKDRQMNDEPLPEYDFEDGVRGKYADRFDDGRNVVVLDPDVAEKFKDSAAVNGALRKLGKQEAS